MSTTFGIIRETKSFSLLGLSLLVPLASAMVEYLYGNNFFHRSGSIMVLIALILESKAVIRLFRSLHHSADAAKTQAYRAIWLTMSLAEMFTGGRTSPVTEAENFKRSEAADDDAQLMEEAAKKALTELYVLSRVALFVGVIGTVIWGYGDLFVSLLDKNPAGDCVIS